MDLIQNAPNGGAADLVKESSTASFAADVIEASRETPVLVDFWAPWCGPCRQLTPALEKVVGEKAGAVKLVKINVDENQALAGQMGIQSIPAVFAFSGGKPVDGFMGALPESEIRKFIDRLPAGNAPAQDGGVGEILDAAEAALEAGDAQAAGDVFMRVLQVDPANARAIVGLARVQLETGDAEGARRTLGQLPADSGDVPGKDALEKALELAEQAAALGGSAELRRKAEASPDDLQARFDLALALNGEGNREEAADALIEIVRRDREWQEDGARKKLVELFEAWGPKDPATAKGRRQLSSLLFS